MLYTKIQDASDKEIVNIDIASGYPFKQKWDLVENLKLAEEDEKAEIEIYKNYASVAEKEGFPDIAFLFEKLAGIENCHAMRFNELYTQLKDGSIYKKQKEVKWKCADCGYEPMGKSAPKVCPVCQAKQGSFMLIFDEIDAQSKPQKA